MGYVKKTTKKPINKAAQNNEIKIEEEFEPIEVEEQPTYVEKEKVQPIETTIVEQKKPYNREDGLINCLRNEKVIVRLIRKKRGFVEDPRSPLYGGLADTSKVILSVPMLRNGVYKNILTNSEKDYLEYVMGLDKDALSIYRRKDNYWSTSTKGCINKVVLTKQDLTLDLSIVDDYIKYKILLANDDRVCPSLSDLEDKPKSTYMFVLVNDKQEAKSIGKKANLKYECYVGYGKYKDNNDVLRCIITLFDNKKVAPDTKLEHLQNMVTGFIESDPRRFLSIVNDELLEYKTLIKRCVEKGLINNRNNFYYVTEDGMKLCEEYEEPRLHNAAAFLAKPINTDLRNLLEAKCNMQ